MSHHLSPEEKLTGARLQFDVLLAEYNKRTEDIFRLRNAQGQLDNIALAGLALSVPLILAITENDKSEEIGVILLLPVIFFAITFTQIRHERTIIAAATYIDGVLGPAMSNLISRLSDSKVSVLEYTRHLTEHSLVPNQLVDWISITGRCAISIAIGVGLIAVFLFLRIALFDADWQGYEVVLLALNTVVLVGDLVLAYFTAGTRQDYLTARGYYDTINVAKSDADSPSDAKAEPRDQRDDEERDGSGTLNR
jgi:hypothetical protein